MTIADERALSSDHMPTTARAPSAWPTWLAVWAAMAGGLLASFGVVMPVLRLVGVVLAVIAVARASRRLAPVVGFLVTGLAATGSDPSPDGSAGRLLLYMAAATLGAVVASQVTRVDGARLRRVALTALALVVVLAGALPGPALPTSGPSEAELAGARLTPEVAKRLDDWLRAEVVDRRAPGFSVSVVSADDVLFERGYGVAGSDRRGMEPTTPVVLASVSKSFTALAVLLLAEEGKLDLDAPVRTYIPSFAVADEDVSARMTVRDTVNQTTGLATKDGINAVGRDQSIEEAVAYLAKVKPAGEPGQLFRYSNQNLQIAGRLVEVASGQTFPDYLREHVLVPLGMDHTTAQVDPTVDGLQRADGYATFFGLLPLVHDRGVPAGSVPAGGVSASAADLGRYLRLHLGNGSLDGSQIVPVEGMNVLHAPPGGFDATDDDEIYNMGWQLQNDARGRWVEHGGAWTNTSTSVAFFPDENLAVAVVAPHMSLASAPATRIRNSVLDIVRGDDTPPPGRRYVMGYATVMMAMAALIAFVVRAATNVRGWPKRSGRPRLLRIGWVVLSHLALPLLVIVGFPAAYGVPWALQYRFLPDLVSLLLIAYGTLFVTGLLKLRQLRTSGPVGVAVGS